MWSYFIVKESIYLEALRKANHLVVCTLVFKVPIELSKFSRNGRRAWDKCIAHDHYALGSSVFSDSRGKAMEVCEANQRFLANGRDVYQD